MIWLLLLIPALTVLLLVRFFRKQVLLSEYIMVFAVPVIAILIGNFASISSQTSATEYINTYLTKARYTEAWNEWHHETCYRTVVTGHHYDSQTKTTHQETIRVPYDCSHEQRHSAYWEAEDNAGATFSISQDYFEYLAKLWGTRNFREMNRNYYTQDGNVFDTWYDQNVYHAIPICREHTYENKVRVSKAYFNFKNVTPSDVNTYGLYDYPQVKSTSSVFQYANTTANFNFNPVLGCFNDTASKILMQYNAINGATKQLHMMLLVFPNQSYEAGNMQESYWCRGNKNEFILCVGLKGKFITWTKAISWTKNEDLKRTVAEHVKDMGTFNAVAVANYLGQNVPPTFARRQFKEFNFLTVRPTNTAIIITLIITVLLSAGLAVFAIKNEFK